MDAQELVASLAGAANVRALSTSGANQVFRIQEETGRTSIVKVYATPARERRERHALEALDGTLGIPTILERGIEDSLAWIRMSDGGAWSLATLSHNVDAIRRAGSVLRAVHDSGAPITNLDSGIDGEYVHAHFLSTLDRLGRFRRRLELPADVLEAARQTRNLPISGTPRPAHTRPYPRNFLVSDSGGVTLVDWTWATLAPPEWDLSLASWRFSREIGSEAVSALREGYGDDAFPDDRIDSWKAYHAAMAMLEAAEQREGRLGDLSYLVTDLSEAVG